MKILIFIITRVFKDLGYVYKLYFPAKLLFAQCVLQRKERNIHKFSTLITLHQKTSLVTIFLAVTGLLCPNRRPLYDMFKHIRYQPLYVNMSLSHARHIVYQIIYDIKLSYTLISIKMPSCALCAARWCAGECLFGIFCISKHNFISFKTL